MFQCNTICNELQLKYRSGVVVQSQAQDILVQPEYS